MTAGRRVTMQALGGLAAAMMLAAPVAAQNAAAPAAVTAAPPVSTDTVGPSQLQNFNLQGTVTRPAERSTSPAVAAPAQPQLVPPATSNAVPAQADRGPAAGPPSVRTRPAVSTSQAPIAAAPTATIADAAPPSLPLEVKTGAAPQTEDVAATPPAASLAGSQSFLSWPWLAALIAVIGGGVFIAWNRRGKSRRQADPGRVAFAGLVPDTEVEPAPFPPARPRPDPVPPRAQPAPRPDPVPAPAPKPATKPADDGLVRSTGLKPELNFQFKPDRAVITDHEVLLQFDVVLTNSGAAPARDVLVEAKLVPAHAGQDQEIAAFFEQPEATGDRMAGIPPLGKVSLKSAVRLPLDQLHSFEVDGRKLFVPLIAFNILFRGGGGEGQASASFLVGRGNDGDEKLAPFRLDLGPRVFRGLSARPHSMGLAS
ncbi:hypothetical protein [Sphingomonas sp.]|uniref:hypothetical protein n=1 Tax=Sphingomonas sp. TaxID=28214 RepID=UPI0025F65C26|nr:hypothetical protein [Sphingomonas sp.]